MINKSEVYLILLSVIVLASCSADRTIKKDRPSGELAELYLQDVKLTVNEIYSWVNLMPGIEPRFHITGDVDLLYDREYDLEFVKLESIVVYQNSEIYRISPSTKEFIIDKTIAKKIRFSTINGLFVNRELNIDKHINIDLVFNYAGEKLIYKIDNIKIHKAY